MSNLVVRECYRDHEGFVLLPAPVYVALICLAGVEPNERSYWPLQLDGSVTDPPEPLAQDRQEGGADE